MVTAFLEGIFLTLNYRPPPTMQYGAQEASMVYCPGTEPANAVACSPPRW